MMRLEPLLARSIARLHPKVATRRKKRQRVATSLAQKRRPRPKSMEPRTRPSSRRSRGSKMGGSSFPSSPPRTMNKSYKGISHTLINRRKQNLQVVGKLGRDGRPAPYDLRLSTYHSSDDCKPSWCYFTRSALHYPYPYFVFSARFLFSGRC